MATIDKIKVNGTEYDLGGTGSFNTGSEESTSQLYLIGATTQVASTKTYSSGDIRIKDNELFVSKNGASSSTDNSRLAVSGKDMRLKALKTVSGVEMSQHIDFNVEDKTIVMDADYTTTGDTYQLMLDGNDNSARINQLKLKDSNTSSVHRVFIGSSAPSGTVSVGDVWIDLSEV